MGCLGSKGTMRASSREVMVATMTMASSRETTVVNNRGGMEVTSSPAMEHPLRSRASSFNQSPYPSSSNRGFGVQGVLSKVVGEVLVEARLHLV